MSVNCCMSFQNLTISSRRSTSFSFSFCSSPSSRSNFWMMSSCSNLRSMTISAPKYPQSGSNSQWKSDLFSSMLLNTTSIVTTAPRRSPRSKPKCSVERMVSRATPHERVHPPGPWLVTSHGKLPNEHQLHCTGRRELAPCCGGGLYADQPLLTELWSCILFCSGRPSSCRRRSDGAGGTISISPCAETEATTPCFTDSRRCVCWKPFNISLSWSCAWLINFTSVFRSRSFTSFVTSGIVLSVTSSLSVRTYFGLLIGSTEHSENTASQCLTKALNCSTSCFGSISLVITMACALSSARSRKRMKSRRLLSKPLSARVAELCVALPRSSSMPSTRFSYSSTRSFLRDSIVFSRTRIDSSYEEITWIKYPAFNEIMMMQRISLW
mmetsp:Transcript_127874/g.368299  ORF Transcript_127874/g.368299 Transcript_127874/m.368299 type:complete len:383 (+) Transcript_127874:424-1572(+)